MPALPLAAQSYEDGSNGLPPELCVNLYAEAAGDQQGVGFNLIGTPGATSFCNLGSGTIRGGFFSPGVLGSDIYVAHETTIYKITSAGVATAMTGSIAAGTDRVKFAGGSTTQLACVAGGYGYIINGTTVTQVTDVDFPSSVSDVEWISNYFVWIRSDTGQIWPSEVADGSSNDALTYATAERSPDNLVGLAVSDAYILLFGQSTTEFWSATGDFDQPFAAATSSALQRGCIGRDAITKADNGVFFVGDDRIVYVIDGASQNTRVSTHPIERMLGAVADADLSSIIMWSYADRGHTFVGLDIPSYGTFVFDAATRKWHRRQSYGLTLWRFNAVLRVGNKILGFPRSGGVIGQFSGDVYAELSNPLIAEFTCNIPLGSGRPPLYSTSLLGSKGVGLATGQGSDPQIAMSYSDDRGNTWSGAKLKGLGAMGEYTFRTIWRRLGAMRAPGRILKFTLSDPVKRVFTGVVINEEFL